MALAGPDGRAAAQLLAKAQHEGTLALYDLTSKAVRRLLTEGNPFGQSRLFNPEELQHLTDALAAVNGTAELLGRSRIRLRMVQAQQHEDAGGDFAEFADAPTSLGILGDALAPFLPEKALDWFRSLVPLLRVDARRWPEEQRRKAFTLAVATDQTLLEKVKGVIEEKLRTGVDVKGGPQQVQAVLDEAGVTPRNPQYPALVMRTNMMSAYNAGAQEELREVQDSFPVWQYLGIDDLRAGKDHAPHFNRYYPSSVPFEQVRGERVWNCRCSFAPVWKGRWRKLYAAGARVDPKYPDVPGEVVRAVSLGS